MWNPEESDLWSREEQEILQSLDEMLRQESVRQGIDEIAARLQSRVNASRGNLLDREPVPLSLYGGRLPGVIRSSAVFLIREGAVTGAERHPNSHQRSIAYRGTGYFEVHQSPDFDDDSEGASYLLMSDFDAPLETRWASIPVNLWHQAVVSEGDWIVVSFHTADEKEIIEERPATSELPAEE